MDVPISNFPASSANHLSKMITIRLNVALAGNGPIPSAVEFQREFLNNYRIFLTICSHATTARPIPTQPPSPSHDFAQLFTTVQALDNLVKILHIYIKLIKKLISAVHALQEEVENIKNYP